MALNDLNSGNIEETVSRESTGVMGKIGNLSKKYKNLAGAMLLASGVTACGGGGGGNTTPTTTVDTLPNAFNFLNQTNLVPSSTFTTNTITISGVNTTVSANTTLGNLIVNGIPVGGPSAIVKNGDKLAVTGTASSLNSTTLNGQVTIGGKVSNLTDIFTITTQAPVDKTPNAFNFTDITNLTPGSTYTSNTITVGGLGTQVNINTTIGTLIINGINTGLTSSLVTNLDTVAITGTAPATNNTTSAGNVTIGTLTDPFAITTAPVINTAPTAQDVILDLGATSTITYNLNPNIADAQTPDNLLTVNIIGAPANGTVTLDPVNLHNFTYTANAGFSGTDTFTYMVVDPQTLKSAIRTVTLNNIMNNTAPVIGTPSSTGNILFGQNLTNISVPITDDNLSLVTWTLSYTPPAGSGFTGTFSTTTGTGNTLNGITFTPIGASTGRTVKATIVDSGSVTTNVVTIYSN